jgi:hypothetical protein
MSQGQAYTIEEAIMAHRALGKTLGLVDEQFDTSAMVGMLSDEIEKLRAAGQPDEKISAIIQKATGKCPTPSETTGYYAKPGERHR